MALLWLAIAMTSGCDRAPEGNATIIVPNAAATPEIDPQIENAAPALNASADRIEPLSAVTPSPTPSGEPARKMQVRKDFADPPLPPELNQDGGLKPLPPRPH